MRELNLRPQGGPGKKGTNTANKNADGSVTLNDSIRLTDEGQNAVFRKKYSYHDSDPYLGKYGKSYADKEGFETKGAGNASFKNGYVSFGKNAYNQQDQEKIFGKMRNDPTNKGREFYLKGAAAGSKYGAPSGYKYNKTKSVNPINSVK